MWGSLTPGRRLACALRMPSTRAHVARPQCVAGARAWHDGGTVGGQRGLRGARVHRPPPPPPPPPPRPSPLPPRGQRAFRRGRRSVGRGRRRLPWGFVGPGTHELVLSSEELCRQSTTSRAGARTVR
eukprot:scaffold947_cov375-Prasinococcus_capsulatus_cf.AAC.12